jgi:hypothetical protein
LTKSRIRRTRRAVKKVRGDITKSFKYTDSEYYYNVRFEGNDLVYVQDGDITLILENAITMSKKAIILKLEELIHDFKK